jgi:hypothetical protein
LALEDAIKLATQFGADAIETIKDENCEDLVSIMKDMIHRSF